MGSPAAWPPRSSPRQVKSGRSLLCGAPEPAAPSPDPVASAGSCCAPAGWSWPWARTPGPHRPTPASARPPRQTPAPHCSPYVGLLQLEVDAGTAQQAPSRCPGTGGPRSWLTGEPHAASRLCAKPPVPCRVHRSRPAVQHRPDPRHRAPARWPCREGPGGGVGAASRQRVTVTKIRPEGRLGLLTGGTHRQPGWPGLPLGGQASLGLRRGSLRQAEGCCVPCPGTTHALSEAKETAPVDAHPAADASSGASLPPPLAGLPSSRALVEAEARAGGETPPRHPPWGRGEGLRTRSAACLCHCLCKQVNCFLPQLKTSAT